jgi:hypothetical protein
MDEDVCVEVHDEVISDVLTSVEPKLWAKVLLERRIGVI